MGADHLTCQLCEHAERRWADGAEVLVYRCSRCGGCYGCGHAVDLEGRRWRCADGRWRPVIFDPGIVKAGGRLL